MAFWMTRTITEFEKKKQEVAQKWAISADDAIKKFGGAVPMLKEMYNDREYLTDVHPAVYLLSHVIGELEDMSNRLQKLEKKENDDDRTG